MLWRLRRPAALGDEAKLFLDGKYLELAYSTGRDLPAWVWLSTLGHADEATLSLAETWHVEHEGERPEYGVWGTVLEHLVVQLREVACALDVSIASLQRSIIVPLELVISTNPVGPATLYRLVSRMLAEVGADREVEPTDH